VSFTVTLDMICKKYVLVPEQEFVKASVLMSVVENSEIAGAAELEVSGPAYVMGLLDLLENAREEPTTR
jgi:predicted translin family RNA/ssDNA-binding protein